MVDYDDQIRQLEEELGKTQYNKATEHHFGVVKARIAKLRERKEKRAGVGKSSAGFSVRKSGDATVVILGFPSVGKSTLLNALTGAKSRVAAYAFTTLDVIPGIMEYNHAKIQILDCPGIIEGAAHGTGRGREVLSIVRGADLVLILLDALHPEHYPALLNEIGEANVRINQKAPSVRITKATKGGVSIQSSVKLTHTTPETLQAILREFHINNAEVILREDVTIDQFIDVVEANRAYLPAVLAVSKSDLLDERARKAITTRLHPDVFVSCEEGTGVAEGMSDLKQAIYNALRLIRVYLKEVNKKADMDVPMVLRSGTTVRDVCGKIHRDLVKKFKYIRIWGPSAKFPGQQFKQLDKVLSDGDVIEVHSR